MSQVLQELNLARKLRPQDFNSIVGQALSVQLLKNSLARNKFFPVYLFSGQRGCGKTSTARVFAAAVNCQKLVDFQRDSSIPFPCTQCSSCVSTRSGNHPDFIEIDAASNTGVDNVRSILETCSYMPLLGRKKIYLIDEAHMLSKSAFNAFLKMLEEPPASVIFILATTEALKIPDTVRSRCFQLLFKTLPPEDMKRYLERVCAAESIAINQDALMVLMHEVDGCMRDALNLLEQVRFLGHEIDEKTVLTALGLISKQHLYGLFDILVAKDVVGLLKHLDAMNFVTISPQVLWNGLLQLCRSLMWKKYGVNSTSVFAAYDALQIENLSKKCSFDRLQEILQQFWESEEFFLKTPQKHLFLEHILIQVCRDGSQFASKVVAQGPQVLGEVILADQQEEVLDAAVPTHIAKIVTEPMQNLNQYELHEPFVLLVKEIVALQDRLLTAIFSQAKFLGIDRERKFVRLGLVSVSSFYQDKVRETQTLWQPILNRFFSNCNDFSMEALPQAQGAAQGVRSVKASNQPLRSAFGGSGIKNSVSSSGPDISDTKKWAQANLLTQQFSGKLELIKDDSE